MRIARLITWICTACLAGLAAVYGVALVQMLLNGRIAQFSKIPTGRSVTWADQPGLVALSAIGHAMLLVFMVMLPIWTWRSLPGALSRLQRFFGQMSASQRVSLCMMLLPLIATVAALSCGLPSGHLRGPVIVAIWLLWFGACVQLPLLGLKRGEVHNSSGKVIRHADDPAGFWRRWAAVTAKCAFTLGLATVVCWVRW